MSNYSKKNPTFKSQENWSFSYSSLFRSIRIIRLIIIFFLVLSLSLITNHQSLITGIKAQDCPSTDLDCQIAQLQKEYDSRKDAHEKNKSDLASYNSQLLSVQKKLIDLDNKLKQNEKAIFSREVEMGVQEELLSLRIREMYKRNREFSFLTILLSSNTISSLNQDLALRQTTAKQDWRIINNLSLQITSLKKDKESLKKNQISLAGLKAQVDKQIDFLAAEVQKTESFFTQIKAKQQQLLALKAGGFSTSVGDVPPADDPASRPDYNPGFSPAFAAFSFGAPHFNGLSQYGAYGRSKEGQNAETILRAYYGDVEIKKDYNQSATICVGNSSGSCNRISLETYAKRIYEVPGSWGDNGGFEALKAQAVAVRSYALSDMSQRGYICATESCQVYKPANKGGKWEEAVNATAGWVMIKNGKPFRAKFAASAGGYIRSYTDKFAGYSTPGFWDTKNGRNGWTGEAYEKIAGSPWFYKAWYRTRSGASSGRSHPWLNEGEMSDILNCLLVYKGDSSSETHLSQLDANIPQTWDFGKVREEAGKYNGPVSNISSVNVVYSDDGLTSRVNFSTDRGTKEFSGEDFKHIFNLRSPGAIGLKSGLFNIVRK